MGYELRKVGIRPRHLAPVYPIAGSAALVDNAQKGRVTKWMRIDQCRRLSHSLELLEDWL